MLTLFENEYLRKSREKIYIEEISLILYFAIKHQGEIHDDTRVLAMVDMFFNRVTEF